MLLDANLIDEVQMRIALAEQANSGKRFGSTLLGLQFIDENVLAAFLSRQIDVPCISLLHVDIPRKVLRKLTGPVARECHAIPVRMHEDRLEVAMADPTDIEIVTRLEEAAGSTIVPLVAPESSIEKMIDRFYPRELEDDETIAARVTEKALDPHFRDLIEELETGDFDQRLDRIEDTLDRVWVLLERILRRLESAEVTVYRHEEPLGREEPR